MADTFPISGNIDPKAFPFLLMDLHRQGATGSLKVEGPAYPKALYYRSGRILFGSSNDPKDQLGAILIESGKIAPEQLADVNTKVGPGNPLAKVLAESGFVNQRELGEAARVKVERILSDIIGYTSGSFEFEDGVLPKGAVDLKLSTEKLVLAAVRRVVDRSFVLRHVAGLEVVMAPKADAAAALSEVRADASDLTSHLDGRRSLREAAQLSRVDEFEAAKVACALLFLGLIEPVRPGAAVVAVEPELDLAETAAMAFGAVDPQAPAAPAPPASPLAEASDDPFFTGASESGPLDLGLSSPFAIPDTAPVVTSPEPRAPAETDPFAAVAPQPEIAFEAPSPASLSEAPTLIVPPPTEEPTAFADPSSLETTALPVMEPPPAPPPELQPAPASYQAEADGKPSFRMPAGAEVGHEPLPPSRPSKEDLAALDALLNPATSPRPLEPARTAPNPGASGQWDAPRGPARSGRWEPQFQSMARPRRPTRRQTAPVLLIALAVGVITVIGGGSWYYLKYVQAPPLPVPPVTQARATRPPSPVAPAPTPTTPVEAPTAGPATAPPATAVPTPQPTARAAAPPASPLDSGPVTEARSLMRKGSLGPAAEGFAANVKATPGTPFTIQLLVACSTDTVQKALDQVAADDLYILPVNYKGKSCHRICWGLYDSESVADAAARRLPGYFAENGATPKVVRTATLVR